FENPDRAKPLDIQASYVRSDNGNLIQMDNLLTLKDTAYPAQLYHYNRFESATISATPAQGKTIGDGIDELNKLAKAINPRTNKAYLPGSVTTELTGASRDFVESSGDIVFALVLALVLIYLILAAQFESFIDPFIIMLTVPLAMAGALLFLWYFNCRICQPVAGKTWYALKRSCNGSCGFAFPPDINDNPGNGPGRIANCISFRCGCHKPKVIRYCNCRRANVRPNTNPVCYTCLLHLSGKADKKTRTATTISI